MSKRILFTLILTGLLLASCGGDLANPPLIYLVADGKLVDGFQSTYCWDQGIGGEICVDTVEPYFESSIPLDVDAPIRFQLDTPLPKMVTLTISKEVLDDTIFSETMRASELIEWSPAVAPGEYIINVDATWRQGVVTYWFSVWLE
jgi:hypothetical protein